MVMARCSGGGDGDVAKMAKCEAEAVASCRDGAIEDICSQ